MGSLREFSYCLRFLAHSHAYLLRQVAVAVQSISRSYLALATAVINSFQTCFRRIRVSIVVLALHFLVPLTTQSSSLVRNSHYESHHQRTLCSFRLQRT
ncbi:hypothetical protein N431DRAFT_109416 [Stipitochalara longipes BDJ]|nr:hypothetical protein N431DRAFT_109416 [Stipitochalara longipes BDJ]